MYKVLVNCPSIEYFTFFDKYDELEVGYKNGLRYLYKDITREEFNTLISYPYPESYFDSRIVDNRPSPMQIVDK